MKPYYFGIDVGGTTVKLGLYHEPDGWKEKWEIPTRTQDGGANILPDIAQAVQQACARHAVELSDIAGIGLGVPGPVLDDGTVNGCVNLGWGVFNVADELSGLTGLPVYAANDANIAVLGEQWKGAGSKYQNVVLLTLGTAVGGGIVLNGRIWAGSNGAGGEIGHMPLADDVDEPCNCGKVGCLEQAGSATAVIHYAKKLLAGSDEPSLMRGIEPLMAKDICECCANGDVLAQKCIDRAAKALGKACACIGCMFDPEVFLFGGGMSAAGELLLEPIRQTYREQVFPRLRETPIARATLGNDAGITGAVRLIQLHQNNK